MTTKRLSVLLAVLLGMSAVWADETITVPFTNGTYATCSRERWLKIVSGWIRGIIRGLAKSNEALESASDSPLKSCSR